MRTQATRRVFAALLIAALATLGFAGAAQAKLTGEFTRFKNCEYKSLTVKKCIYSTTESGEVVLGSKKVPIVNPVVLQGGYGKAGEDGFSTFFGATNGVPTLQPVAQPVPGGLAGIINCNEIKDIILKASCKLVFENGVTGLFATLELARPASEIRISENNLAGEAEVALKLPVKVRLENPFLGSGCYVGSSGTPLRWELTSGKTEPPPPNKSIHGSSGFFEILEEGTILRSKGASLVDNAWSAPGVTGCGGFLVELILNPIINAAAGLPAKAGVNTAILNNTVYIASRFAVNENDELNP
jgi:hypothetical protein